jgi:hypothetical protein
VSSRDNYIQTVVTQASIHPNYQPQQMSSFNPSHDARRDSKLEAIRAYTERDVGSFSLPSMTRSPITLLVQDATISAGVEDRERIIRRQRNTESAQRYIINAKSQLVLV